MPFITRCPSIYIEIARCDRLRFVSIPKVRSPLITSAN
jgi:hypothetical protein